MDITKRVTLRLEKDVMDKLKFISSQTHCSVNEQINLYISQWIEEYEKNHGDIEINEKQ